VNDVPRISVSVKEAAKVLGVSPDHIDDLRHDGKIRWAKSGARVLIEYASLVEYFESGRVA
jgi:excisionase family DNA binding protein